MTDFTDGYLTRYQYLRKVYDGTLESQDGTGQTYTGVKYRVVETDEENTNWTAPGDGALAETQTFEVWTITLNSGGYNPKPGDIFTDVDGQPWYVIKQDKGDLISSGRLRPTISLFCWKKQ